MVQSYNYWNNKLFNSLWKSIELEKSLSKVTGELELNPTDATLHQKRMDISWELSSISLDIGTHYDSTVRWLEQVYDKDSLKPISSREEVLLAMQKRDRYNEYTNRTTAILLKLTVGIIVTAVGVALLYKKYT